MGVPGHLLHLFREAPSKRRLLRSLALGGRGGDRTVTSADGTRLSVRRSGDGVPVVLVHGTLDGISAFSLIELTIAERHAVWVYDRRGRGGSGDQAEYSLQREIEDLEAVLAAAGSPAHVVGHSFGALIALAAAASGTAMRSLVLYEPPLRQDQLDHRVITQVEALVACGDLDRAITVMATELAGVSEDEIAVPRRIKPMWNQLRDGVGATPRELEVVSDVRWDRFDLPVRDRPVLVIRGDRDHAPAYPRPEDLPRFVTDPEITTLPGQGHLATTFAPARFAEVVLDFIDRH
ncbi:MAG TPA: alpha/beta hydrolase [Acidimicrobiales bacterium]|nr:alpha/beta hydrolase [Acidimicrobiales bacterium]